VRIYDINYRKLVALLLPTFLRAPLTLAFLRSAAHPAALLKSRLDTYRADTDYRLQHNGQVCRLRKALNDRFDPVARRIRISDADTNRQIAVIHVREVARWKIVPQRPAATVLNRRGFAGAGGHDFIVGVPAECMSRRDEIAALTDIYKLVSKRYLISRI
jgi:hypothetical protein